MNNIQNILNEIYAVDPELRAYEQELIKIIQEIINKRPDTKFDEAFAKELRTEVLKRAQELNLTKAKEPSNMFAFFERMPRWSYAVAGAAIMTIIILPLAMDTNVRKSSDVAMSLNTGVVKLASNAFGSLTAEIAGNDGTLGINNDLAEAEMDISPKASSQITDSGENVTEESMLKRAASSMPVPFGLGGGGGSDRMIMPNPFSFEFEYMGEDVILSESTAEVYRRINPEVNSNVASILSGVNIGLINLNAIDNLDLQSLGLVQDKPFGFIFNYSSEEGSFSVYKNWLKWPNPQNDCREEDCYQRTRLRINDVPGDDTIISLADNFLSDMGVDKSIYKEPYIQDDWRKSYERAENKDDAWVPEEIQVIYPLNLEGQTVYDYGGKPSGLTVSVDVRNRRGSGMYNLFPYNYQASEYELVTDFARILKLAMQGGDRPVYYFEETKQVPLELGTPEKVLMQHYKYDGKGSNNALYIPAMKFPIINYAEVGYYYGQDSVMVPLLEEIVAEWEERYPEGDDNVPVPMPLLRGVPEPAVDVPAVEPMIEPGILAEDNE